jgi:cytochrome c553
MTGRFLTLVFLSVAAHAATSEQLEFFEKKVRPILAAKCQNCHGAKMQMAGLNLATAEGVAKGADSGPIIDKADAPASRLLKALAYTGKIKMPPTGKLSDEDMAAITEWVKQGAPFPASAAPATKASVQLWSFQPRKQYAPPSVKNADWARNEIDRFILAKLEDRGLSPAKPASKATLLRRVTFDLTGLPPTPAELASFENDTSPQAYEKVIDRLLTSPRYGERWGRHWLDVARYADSTGLDEDHRYPHAWRYRDYVIDTFNLDVPYDQFLKEQIAGDQLPAESEGEINRRGLVATGFLALGPKPIAQQDKQRLLYDVVDEQIDTFSKAVLGVTLACARCHDHKFDPISTRDYYSMAAIFASTKTFNNLESFVSEMYTAPLVPQGEFDTWRQHKRRISETEKAIAAEKRRWIATQSTLLAEYLDGGAQIAFHNANLQATAQRLSIDETQLKKWADFLKANEKHATLAPLASAANTQAAARTLQSTFVIALAENNKAKDTIYALLTGKGAPLEAPEKLNTEEFKKLEAELDELKRTLPKEPAMANGVGEGTPIHQRVFLRGNHLSPGDYVNKAVPAALAPEGQPNFRSASGRKELAAWLVAPQNPLTSRVIVNRIWQWHFGEGIVRTPSNWGVTGAKPTHPELLDWLAQRFIDDGWSFKKLHKRILLSAAYQQSADAEPQTREKDPSNELFGRFPRRRLDVEEMRDAMLALDGTLDLTMGGTLQEGQGTDGENDDKRRSIDPASSKRRTVYLPLRRSNLPALLNLFDFGDATTSNDQRTRTNIAPQALFVMNSPFVAERAATLSANVRKSAGSDRDHVAELYLRIYGRPATPAELDQALTFLASGKLPNPWTAFTRVLLGSNEFWYVD